MILKYLKLLKITVFRAKYWPQVAAMTAKEMHVKGKYEHRPRACPYSAVYCCSQRLVSLPARTSFCLVTHFSYGEADESVCDFFSPYTPLESFHILNYGWNRILPYKHDPNNPSDILTVTLTDHRISCWQDSVTVQCEFSVQQSWSPSNGRSYF